MRRSLAPSDGRRERLRFVSIERGASFSGRSVAMSTKAKPTRAKGKSRRKSAPREETSTGLDPRVIKALGHPLRQSILLILNERVASPMEIARQLDEPIGNV